MRRRWRRPTGVCTPCLFHGAVVRGGVTGQDQVSLSFEVTAHHRGRVLDNAPLATFAHTPVCVVCRLQVHAVCSRAHLFVFMTRNIHRVSMAATEVRFPQPCSHMLTPKGPTNRIRSLCKKPIFKIILPSIFMFYYESDTYRLIVCCWRLKPNDLQVSLSLTDTHTLSQLAKHLFFFRPGRCQLSHG